MPIYEFNESGLKRLHKTTFADHGVHERQDIQRLLRDQIEIISEKTLVIAEEFGDWDVSRRRIDLLCIDKSANLVVVELKRTEDGGHMELQALRYSAMVSIMTFDQVVDAHKAYLVGIGSSDDAERRILDFLGWEEPDEDAFAQDVRIVLASAEFSKELTSAVLWLNDKGVDIRCVKLEPYFDGQKLFLDVQQVIPLPETEQFQVQVRQKKQKEQQARTSSRDYSKFTLNICGREYLHLNKRKLMHQLVRELIDKGINPMSIMSVITWKGKLFISYQGQLNEDEFVERIAGENDGEVVSILKRYFCKRDELFVVDGATYALTNQWGKSAIKAVELLSERYPNLHLSIERE